VGWLGRATALASLLTQHGNGSECHSVV